jgi:hypothetical protein
MSLRQIPQSGQPWRLSQIDDFEDSVNGINIGSPMNVCRSTLVNLTQNSTVLVSTQDGDRLLAIDYV